MLWNYIRHQMLRRPGRTLAEGNAVMTYEEAVIYAESVAKGLDAPCYAILCQSELAAALALLSCLAAGVTAVPLSMKYGEAHCHRILNAVRPPRLLSDMGGGLHATDIDQGAYRDDERHRPALIMCTSGTTGKPKGAMLSQRNLLTNLHDIEAYFEVEEGARILIARPLYHSAVLTGELLVSLAKGLDIRFCSGSFDPCQLIRLIHTHRITVMGGTPTMFRLLGRYFRVDREPLPLRQIVLSGECLGRLAAGAIRASFPDAQIYHVYGLTEASPRVAFLPPEEFDKAPETVGYPLASVEVRVTGEKEESLPAGVEGELWVRGRNVMMGYYDDPQLTAEVLRDGWLRTRDIAVIDEQGRLQIKCRRDDLIIRAGMNVYPQEIEDMLRADERVEDVLAYGIPSAIGGEKIGLKLRGNIDTVEEALTLCRRLLPTYAYPSRIELVDELPKNGSGKLIRRIADA